MSRTVLLPNADHPITIEPTHGRVVVRIGDRVVADSYDSRTLREASYPPVQYLPIADVDQSVLRRSETTSYCPYKGDASYLSVETADGTTLGDVIWTYEEPYPAVADIAGRVAFYADRVEITVPDAAA
ncbi:DUF427 domain-containing protein [Frankia sp. AiPs1]|uniref:DUF427 domain-containing protein n=1 Tax=Frankia sp. AiPs1 TaxID=573493 RepID=UPI002043F237|nr:DUF427 domain-containing protein [Frankia sp. AiPs1]MCM3922325.1 DUF427 domain-containing protein [Frankia sp. AiPs1]